MIELFVKFAEYPLAERLPMDGLPTHLPAAAIGVATGAPLLGTGAPLPVHPAAHWAIAAAAVRTPFLHVQKGGSNRPGAVCGRASCRVLIGTEF
jgi:hypothetical protein